MSSTESVMSAVYSAISGTTGFVSFVRGNDSVFNSDQLPIAVLAQGDESCDLVTMDGRMDCTLSFDVEISCLKGSQNYETTLNNLKRNLIIQLMTPSFFFTIDELGSSSPQVDQIEGESFYSMSVQLEANYSRNKNDPVNGET